MAPPATCLEGYPPCACTPSPQELLLWDKAAVEGAGVCAPAVQVRTVFRPPSSCRNSLLVAEVSQGPHLGSEEVRE